MGDNCSKHPVIGLIEVPLPPVLKRRLPLKLKLLQNPLELHTSFMIQ
jgi:hypothetical protein